MAGVVVHDTISRMNRREFLRGTCFASLGILTAGAISSVFADTEPKLETFKGTEVFDRILKKATDDNWAKLPIGQCMGKIARELQGTPYVGFTLELSADQEVCAVNLNGLDCVTFFEDTLDFARMLKHGGSTPDDLLKEVTFTRYRDGKLGDFTSRLHYTTDWMVNNEKKKVIEIMAPKLPGAEPFTQKVGIMSQEPKNYRQLVAHPEFIPKIKAIEDQINSRSLEYLPLDKIAAAEPLMQTGDIVGVCTTETGIDIGHTGIIYRTEDGIAHFMDASSSRKNMKVTIDPEIGKALNWSRKITGMMLARPLEPEAV